MTRYSWWPVGHRLLAILAAISLSAVVAASAQAQQPAPVVSAAALVTLPPLPVTMPGTTTLDPAVAVTLDLWLPDAQRKLQALLDAGTTPDAATLSAITATLQQLLASGAPLDPQLSALLGSVVDSLRVLIERLLGNPQQTTLEVLRSLVQHFNELVANPAPGGAGGAGGTPTPAITAPPIALPTSAVLSQSTSGQRAADRRHRAVIVRLSASKTRRSVRLTVRCPAQTAKTCQVTVLARVRARTASRARKLTIKAGTSRTVALRLSRAGRARLLRGGRLSGVARTRFGATTLSSARAISVRRARR